MIRVGLTGGIGAGKSTVGEMFRKLGCKVLDSDLLTRQLFQPGEPVNQEVVRVFGPSVVARDGSINRAVLGEIIFNQPTLRDKLNQIVHPAIHLKQAEFLDAAATTDPAGIAIVDAALMIEVGSYRNYDKVVVVTCTPAVQYHRLKSRGLSDSQIEARIASQMPMEEKVRFADFVIDTSADLEFTRSQVEDVFAALSRSAAARPGN